MPARIGGGQHELGGAEAEDRAPHGEQAGELELEADEEQQQHDAELRHRQDRLRIAKQADAERTDDDAGREIRDDRREPDDARDRHAHHRGGEQHERKDQEADIVMRLVHRGWSVDAGDCRPAGPPYGMSASARNGRATPARPCPAPPPRSEAAAGIGGLDLLPSQRDQDRDEQRHPGEPRAIAVMRVGQRAADDRVAEDRERHGGGQQGEVDVIAAAAGRARRAAAAPPWRRARAAPARR